MTVQQQHAYRFRTAAQWKACVFERVDRDLPGTHDKVQATAPYEQTAELYATRGAHAPAATRAGDILWRDDRGTLHRLNTCQDGPDVTVAQHAIAHASRLVSVSTGLWVVSESRTSLFRYEEESLTRLSTVETADTVIDIAGDGHKTLFALVKRSGVYQALRIDCSGRIVKAVSFEGISDARQFVFLRRLKRFVVLADDPWPRLYWFAAEGGAALISVPIGAMHPCFAKPALGSDTRSRVLLAGADSASLDSKAYVLVFDGDGAPLSEVALDSRDAPANAVTATRDSLLVAGLRGLLKYPLAKAVPDGTAEVRCTVITPVLYSPDRPDQRRWLRVEATATLPQATTLEISYAAIADGKLRDRMKAIASDTALPAAHRLQKLREFRVWSTPIAFHGSSVEADDSVAPFSAPLFDVQEPYLWVCITLIATAGGALPSLNELAVLYPGCTLMEYLPAIYRRSEAHPGSFLRSLVGVLESTSQGLDTRIAALGSHVHPATAPTPWLDFVARWLGLPWDDALDDERKKCLVAHAPDLARGRGTRAGLETLLACLIPGSPRRFRVLDATADLGFATVGGATCRGSALPALLGGSTQQNAELGSSRAVLGRMRLACDQPDDYAQRIIGHIRIDVGASAQERRAWEPWLLALINDMVPVTARVRLRWMTADALRGKRLDGSFILKAAPAPHLGSDAITGLARLPERGNRITATGADIGTRLQ